MNEQLRARAIERGRRMNACQYTEIGSDVPNNHKTNKKTQVSNKWFPPEKKLIENLLSKMSILSLFYV